MSLNEFIELLEKNCVSKEIIDILKDEKKFVYFIDKINLCFNKLDLPYDIRLSILKEIWDKNDKIYNYEFKRNEEYKNKKAKKDIVIEKKENKKLETKKEQEEKENIKKIEVFDVRNLSYEEIIDKLPERNDSNFNDYINEIISKLNEEILIYTMLVKTSSVSKEELLEIKDEIKNIKDIQIKLCNYRDLKLENEKKVTNLVFYSGFFASLEDVVCESLDNVSLALEEIKKGITNKDIPYTNNKNLRNLRKKRKNEIRITYVLVADNTYMLLNTYVKRKTNDKFFRESTANVYKSATDEIVKTKEMLKTNYTDIIKEHQNEYDKVKKYILENRKG